VSEDQPERSDMVVVLAGDWKGERIVKAAELVRRGFAPRILASGVTSHFGIPECTLAVDYAVRRGHPARIFECFTDPAFSTREEAEKMSALLAAQQVRSVIIVTNDAHTLRARNVWRRVAPWLTIRMVASDDNFKSGAWWHDREGWKELFLELLKETADMVGV
jgi:uncharacterized SAM-binding protein YcdF (DUF218 family)